MANRLGTDLPPSPRFAGRGRVPALCGMAGRGELLRQGLQGMAQVGPFAWGDLGLPPRYRPGQREQLRDVVVLGAPVIEGGEPATAVLIPA